MNYKDIIKSVLSNDKLEEYISLSVSVTEVLRLCGFSKSPSGRMISLLRIEMLKLNVDISHFTSNGMKKTGVYKKCPICSKEFYTTKYREGQVCSKSCSNIMFPRARISNYRTICFKYHKRKCIICDESNIVECHHYDNNHKNNIPENLVPLCPTHHRYMHSRHLFFIKECVDDYVFNYKKIMNPYYQLER